MKVAFLGQPGSYSEQAVADHFDAAEAHSQPTFEAVFLAVESGECDAAMIPIENSLAGSVHQNYDLLARHRLFIIGETLLRIRHCLVALPGVVKDQITCVVSHPQALAQCARYLRELRVRTEPGADTASSIKSLSERGDPSVAAIGSRRAAELYNMHILEEGIEDASENFTRFLALARSPAVPATNAKTSVVFTLENHPGALLRALRGFSLRNINIIKIESRPIPNELWGTHFFLDISGGLVDPRVEQALEELNRSVLTMRVLGSYPHFNGQTAS